MDYITIVNELSKWNKEKENLQKKYDEDMAEINKNITKFKSYKEQFLNGQLENVLAKEYVTVKRPENILKYFYLYITSLKNHLNKNWKEFLLYDLQLQDNSYHGDSRKFTEFCPKGHTNQYSYLGGVIFNKDTSIEYFNKLCLILDQIIIKDLEVVYLNEYSYTPKERNPFIGFEYLNYNYSFKIKTDDYDYTKLLELINFPKEIHFVHGTEKSMYKLNGDSYDFYTYERATNKWINEYELKWNNE